MMIMYFKQIYCESFAEYLQKNYALEKLATVYYVIIDQMQNKAKYTHKPMDIMDIYLYLFFDI